MSKTTKKTSYLFTLCSLLFALVFLFPSQTFAAAKLSKKSATLNLGSSLTLKVSGASGKITWASSSKSVATVSSKGVVTGKKKGTATITAKVGKKKLTCKVTVKEATKKVKGTLKFEKSSLTVYSGDTFELNAIPSSSLMTFDPFTWKSSNPSVVSTEHCFGIYFGKLVAKNPGTAIITISKWGVKATCKVTVKKTDLCLDAVKWYDSYANPNTMTYKDLCYKALSGEKVITNTTFDCDFLNDTQKGFVYLRPLFNGKEVKPVWSFSNQKGLKITSAYYDNKVQKAYCVEVDGEGTFTASAVYGGKKYEWNIEVRDEHGRFHKKVRSIYKELGITKDTNKAYASFLLAKWLCDNVEYGSHPDSKEGVYDYDCGSANGVIMSGYGICGGYADAYQFLLEQIGVKCKVIASDSLDHAWNMVKIGSSWYNVDVSTMDGFDPSTMDGSDIDDPYNMKFFFASDIRHDGWVDKASAEAARYDWNDPDSKVPSCTDTRYDMPDEDLASEAPNEENIWFTGEWANR